MDYLGFGGLLSVTCCLSVGWVICLYYKTTYTLFKSLGVRGPSPLPFVGNLREITRQGFLEWHRDNIAKYGKVVGTYHGSRPVLIVADVNMLKQIQVKEFNSFTNRRAGKPGSTCKHLDKMMNRLRDEEWKQVRNTVTPAFSSAKLRKMTSQMNKCCALLIDSLSQTSGDAVDVKAYMGAFALDVIASTAFGIDINSQKDPKDVFIVHAKQCFQPKSVSRLLWLAYFFPTLAPVLKKYFRVSQFPEESVQFFSRIVEQMMDSRTDVDNEIRTDFLQLMVNAHLDHGSTDSRSPMKGLTHEQVLSQGFVFFLAGYTTVSDALTYTMYFLATHPHLQDKVTQSIESADIRDDDLLDYDVLNSMDYLDQFIHESLRLCSPSIFVDRQCNKAININGILIPEGMAITIPIQNIHMDPEAWTDPQQFNPDRFSPEQKALRDSFYFQAFGMGPRSCIGNHLALMEIKMALVYLLRKYKVDTCGETIIPLERNKMSGQPQSVVLRITKRK